MTTRTAELLMALIMGAFSVYLMWKSTELPIGWAGDGPGGGFWPFWLSAVMVVSCIGILVNWVRRTSRPAQSDAPFIELGPAINVGAVTLALLVTVTLFDGIGPLPGIGVYLALPLFIAFYLKIMGNHSWVATLTTMVVTPVAIFLFFEVLLSITLPKGLSEPWFEPVYARVYACPEAEGIGGFLSCLANPE